VSQNGKITVAIPIESAPEVRDSLMTHEFAHGVQIGMGSFSGGYERTIGTIVLTEGFASRVTQEFHPEKPETDAIEYTHGWLEQAEASRSAILKGIRPYLTSKSFDDIMRFTMGKGPNGLEREAYYAGWVVVGYWLKHGMSFGEIARIAENDMPKRVDEAIEAILTSSR
jgi:uncharacterized protein YjaZ